MIPGAGCPAMTGADGAASSAMIVVAMYGSESSYYEEGVRENILLF
jgi:hypothetical protein